MNTKLTFENFIGHWRSFELIERIKIDTQAVSRQTRDKTKRHAAIAKWLHEQGKPEDYYDNLIKTLATQDLTWQRKKDKIMIPGGRLLRMMVEASEAAGKRNGIPRQDLRAYCYISDFVTDKSTHDWTWRRIIPLRDKQGKMLSPNPDIQTDYVIGCMPQIWQDDSNSQCTIQGDAAPFNVSGKIEISDLAPEGFEDQFWYQFDYASQHIGVGCGREMGFGRFAREGGKRIKGLKRQDKEKLEAEEE